MTTNAITSAARLAVANAAARISADATLTAPSKKLIIRMACDRAGVSLDEFISAASQASAEIRAQLA